MDKRDVLIRGLLTGRPISARASPKELIWARRTCNNTESAVAYLTNQNMQSSTDLDGLRKKALVLVWIGQIWNIFEAVVALWSGIGAGSVALIGFGLDSILELAVEGILIWRLQTRWEDSEEESSPGPKSVQRAGAITPLKKYPS